MCFYIWTILQIILESFPISSSGHLVLFERLCPVGTSVGNLFLYEPIRSYLAYMLHIPTVIILCIYFFKEWSFPFKHINRCLSLILKISAYTALADMITVICYLIRDQYGMPHVPLVVGFSITGCSLYSLRWCTYKGASWTAQKAALLGLVQSIAFVPGISRFGLTYVVARWMGIAPRRAFQITMLIQWPLIVLASGYSVYTLDSLTYELLNLPYIMVMLGAALIAYGALCIVGRMVILQSMWMWSVYMLIPLCISIYLLVLGEL